MLTVVRLVRYRDRVVADLLHHGAAVGFFTTVAATCVLGSQFSSIGEHVASPAAALWSSASCCGRSLTYAVFTAADRQGGASRRCAEGINGGWLVAVVAAQSVRVLGAQLAAGFGDARAAGAVLLPGDVARRRDALHLDHLADLLSLHVLRDEPVGSRAAVLDQHGRGGDLDARRRDARRRPRRTRRCCATAAVPEGRHAAVLGDRHLVDPDAGHPRRLAAPQPPLSASVRPLYWGAVFPLGMYTVCTYRLGQVVEVPVLMAIPRVFIWVALLAWTAASVGLIRDLFARRT